VGGGGEGGEISHHSLTLYLTVLKLTSARWPRLPAVPPTGTFSPPAKGTWPTSGLCPFGSCYWCCCCCCC